MFFRDPIKTADEIINIHKRYGIKKFIAWESNFLINSKNHFEKILDRIIESGIKISLSAPEGVAPNMITPELAEKMRTAGYRTIDVPIETASDNTNINRFHRKSTIADFDNAVQILLDAGFKNRDIWVYCLVGMPGQKLDEQVASLIKAWKHGLRPMAMFFTPIPMTEEYEKYKHLISHKDLPELHPLLFPFAGEEYSIEDMEDFFCLTHTVHPLEHMHYLAKDSVVKSRIMDYLSNDTSFRRSCFQKYLYTYINDPEKDIVNKLLSKNNRKTLLVHYYMNDFEKFQQDYQPRKSKETQLRNHRSFRIFIEQLKRRGVKITTSIVKGDYKTVIDLFSFLYMSKQEIDKQLAELKKMRSDFDLTIRFWNDDTPDEFKKCQEYKSGSSYRNLIFFPDDREIRKLLEKNGFLIESMNKDRSFTYVVSKKTSKKI